MAQLAKTILVTGGAGHVGSHVVEMLLNDPRYKDSKVISLDNYTNGSKANHIAGAEYREGSTKDIETLVPEQVDIVYHLGEYARITPSFGDVEKVFEQNTIGTFAVANYCRKRKCKLVYSASSTKFSKELDDTKEGRNANPYAFTKALNVDLIKNFGEWYGLQYAIVYYFNGFGERERGDDPTYGTLIAKYEQAYLKGEPLVVVQPGTQMRNFTYVKDLARGTIQAGEKAIGDGYSLGNTKAFSVKQIAEAFGGEILMKEGNPGRAGSGAAPQKARDELGWDTTLDVLDYIENFKKNNVRGSLKQL